MARSSRQQTARTVAEIKAHARAALGRAAYGGLVLDAVASAAGVTRGAVYHHFGSKEGLFRAVLEDEMAALAARIEQDAAGAADPWQQIRAGCAAFLRAGQDPVTRQIVLLDGPAVLGWQQWRDLDARHVRATLDAGLRQLAVAGRLAVPWAAASIMLSGALNEAALWLGDGPGPRLDDALAVVDAWIRGCAAA